MLKRIFILAAVMSLSACGTVGFGDSTVSFVKKGEVAGTAGLEVAASKCASLEGTKGWQTCVAHYDGLYTKSNGVIKRNYERSADAPKPTGHQEQCVLKTSWNMKTGSWSYSSCEAAVN
jgi:hypothetical protein